MRIEYSSQADFLKALEEFPKIDPKKDIYCLERDDKTKSFHLSIEEKTTSISARIFRYLADPIYSMYKLDVSYDQEEIKDELQEL